MWWMGSILLVSQNNCTPRSLDTGLSHPGWIRINAHRSKACHRGWHCRLIWSVFTHRSRLPTVVASDWFVSGWAIGRNSRLFFLREYPLVSAKWMRHAPPVWPSLHLPYPRPRHPKACCHCDCCWWGPPWVGYMQCSVSWKGATFSHIWEGTRQRVQVWAAGCTHNLAHQRTTRDGLFHCC